VNGLCNVAQDKFSAKLIFTQFWDKKTVAIEQLIALLKQESNNRFQEQATVAGVAWRHCLPANLVQAVPELMADGAYRQRSSAAFIGSGHRQTVISGIYQPRLRMANSSDGAQPIISSCVYHCYPVYSFVDFRMCTKASSICLVATSAWSALAWVIAS
jgi:hypothetical protein